MHQRGEGAPGARALRGSVEKARTPEQPPEHAGRLNFSHAYAGGPHSYAGKQRHGRVRPSLTNAILCYCCAGTRLLGTSISWDRREGLCCENFRLTAQLLISVVEGS